MGEAASLERAKLLQAWLGSEVRVAQAIADQSHVAALPAQERAIVARAVPQRQAEFATARLHARRLLAELGHPCAALAARPDRAPQWPEQVEASITHSAGQCLVIARKRAALGLGVDWEDRHHLPREFWAGVFTATEIATLASRPDAESCAMRTFSLKESLFKAMHGCGNTSLDFLAIEAHAPRQKAHAPWSLVPQADFARRLPEGAQLRAWSVALVSGGVLSAAEVRA